MALMTYQGYIGLISQYKRQVFVNVKTHYLAFIAQIVPLHNHIIFRQTYYWICVRFALLMQDNEDVTEQSIVLVRASYDSVSAGWSTK